MQVVCDDNMAWGLIEVQHGAVHTKVSILCMRANV